MVTDPLSGASIPHRIFSVVDLPAPFSPSRPSVSPAKRLSEISLTAKVESRWRCRLHASNTHVESPCASLFATVFLRGLVAVDNTFIRQGIKVRNDSDYKPALAPAVPV